MKVRHRPARCGCCGKSLNGVKVTAVERRQVIDIPPVMAVHVPQVAHEMIFDLRFSRAIFKRPSGW